MRYADCTVVQKLPSIEKSLRQTHKKAMKEYYITLDDGSQAGPYEETDLRAMIQQGHLPGDTYCWTEGMSEWRPANQIFTLAHRSASQRTAAQPKKKIKTYFVVRGDGMQLGPLSMSQIKKQVYERTLEPDCLFRGEDEEEWRELWRCVELRLRTKWNFFNSICSCYNRTFTYSGRASRGEYGWFMLYSIVMVLIMWVVFVGILMWLATSQIFDEVETTPMVAGWLFVAVLVMVVVLPALAVTVRRFHDMGKSGLLVLLGFVPGVNVIWGIISPIWLLFGASDGPNQYGDRSDNAA